MREFLPEGDPPSMGPLWWSLMRAPCRRCGAAGFTSLDSPGRIFPQAARQQGTPAGPASPESVPIPAEIEAHGVARLWITVLCGECGDVDERAGWAVAT